MIERRYTKDQEIKRDKINKWYEEVVLPNNVLAIGEPYHSEEVFSYLIKGSNENMLIDTGMGVGPMGTFINQHVNPFSKLTIVNSHWHFDHIGGNLDFEKYPILTSIYGDEANLINKGWSHKKLQKYFFEEGFSEDGVPDSFDPLTFEVPGIDNIYPVIDEDWKINLGDRIIRAIHTPGHTPGSLSFFDESNGLLFTSDLLYEGPLYAFEKESDPNDYLESLKKIKRLYGDKIKSIHPGHNYPENIFEPNLIDDAITLFEKAKNGETPDEVGEFPNTVVYKRTEISQRTGKPRRLSVIVGKNYIKSTY